MKFYKKAVSWAAEAELIAVSTVNRQLPIPLYPHTRKHGIILKFCFSGYLSEF